jgi:hypothetical protein
MNSSGKLDAMKTAAKKMIDVLFEGKSTSDTLKIGLVPYSGAVRIGSDKLNSGWLDKATYSNANLSTHPLAFEDYDKVNGISALNLYSAMGRQWPGCVRERGGAYEISDAAPDQNIPASLFVPYLAPDEPSRTQNNRCRTDGNYANDYICEDDVNATCVKPAPSGASNADKEDYERQCRTGKYKSFSGSGPEYNCPPAAAAVTAMTNVKSTITNAINALQADGYTVIPAGLLWGWRVISPGAPYTEGAAYNDEKWIKAVVLLTDGQNDVNGGSNGINKSAYNAFGYAKNGHLGSVNGSQAEAKLDEKTLLVCSAIKNQNPDNPILLYTIGFQVSTSSQNLLRNCATKPDMYYNSPSNDQLTAIFQEIAQGLSELRIAQ